MDFEKCRQDVETELNDKFTDHKMNNNALVESYKRLGMEERASKVFWCGSQLDFKLPEDYSATPKLFRANFCKDRLCNMCSWRRTLKIFGQVSQIMEKLVADQYEFLFVTLTIRNCSASELKQQLDKLQYGFHLFHKQKCVRVAFRGCFKAFEITRHPEHFKSIEYHPHLHLIIAVKKSYFKGQDYIKHSDLIEIWQNACGLDYRPQVDIRKIKPEKSDDGITLAGAVAEVAKYTVKSADVLRGTDAEIDRAVLTLTEALSSRRLCSFTGVFKKAARELKLDDLTDGDLINTDNEQLRSDIAYLIVTYQWQIGYGYQLTHVRYAEKENDHDCQ